MRHGSRIVLQSVRIDPIKAYLTERSNFLHFSSILPTKHLKKVWILLLFLALWIMSKQWIILRSLATFSCTEPSANSTTSVQLRNESAFINGGLSDKWVVLDGLGSPCDEVSGFDQQEGWVMVILIREMKPINGCFLPSCLQLTWEDYKLHMAHLSTTSRLQGLSKIAGYLFAISRGASIIVDAECDRPISDIDLHFRLTAQDSSGLWYNASRDFNPFHHMALIGGYDDDAPPSSNETSSDWLKLRNSEIYFINDFGTVAVRQGVYDQICGYKGSQRDVGTLHPPIVLGPSTLAPLNTGPIAFHKNAFWWMFLPPQSTLYKSNTFRTIWLHQIKRSFLSNIGYYYTPGTNMNKSSTSTQCAPHQLPYTSAKFASLLACTAETQCSESLTPIDCGLKQVQSVLHCLNQNDIGVGTNNSNHTSDLLLAWMSDLLKMEVIQPEFLALAASGDNIFKVKYGFNKQDLALFRPEQVNSLQKNVFEYMAKTCREGKNTSLRDLSKWKKPPINDILLIIVLNYELLFHSVFYTEYVHRQMFKYVVYCGPRADNFKEFAKRTGVAYVTFIQGLSDGWRFMYECITHSMKLNLPVKGYLQIGDDTLLNTWNIVDLPRDQIWNTKGHTKVNLYKTKHKNAWSHWNTTRGQNATINVFSELQAAAAQSIEHSESTFSREFNLLARRFLANYEANIGLNFVKHRAIDFYYVPEVLRHDYILASELFRKHTSLIELAVPVINLGLVREADIIELEGVSLWGENRNSPWAFYTAETTFCHPFKALKDLRTKGGRELFCKTYLPKYERTSRGL